MQQPTTRFQVPPPEQSIISMFKLSPDGRYIVIVALSEGRNRLWIRPLDSLQWQVLQGTNDASYPFWSPDSAYIGFFAQGKLKKIAVTGGPPQTLCDAPGGRGGTWGATGIVLFAPNLTGGLYKVSAAGGVPEPATKLTTTGPSDSQRYPEFLPGGRPFLYLQQTDQKEAAGIYAGSLDGAQPIRLLADQSNAVYVPAMLRERAVISFSAGGHLDGAALRSRQAPARWRDVSRGRASGHDAETQVWQPFPLPKMARWHIGLAALLGIENSPGWIARASGSVRSRNQR